MILAEETLSPSSITTPAPTTAHITAPLPTYAHTTAPAQNVA